ncbi:MAG: hypothetical protein WDO73_33335 [Ignavibacteriota bacterium]
MNHLSRNRKLTLFGTLAVLIAGVVIRYSGGDQSSVVAVARFHSGGQAAPWKFCVAKRRRCRPRKRF